jgi:hypothetical protein
MQAAARLFAREAVTKVYLNGLKIAQGSEEKDRRDLAYAEGSGMDERGSWLREKSMVQDMDLCCSRVDPMRE